MAYGEVSIIVGCIEMFIDGRGPLKKDKLWWRTTLMEDVFWWRRPLMDNELWWKMAYDWKTTFDGRQTFDGKQPLMEDALLLKQTFKEKLLTERYWDSNMTYNTI